MDILTLYAGQGGLAAIRAGDEGIIVDAHMPDTEHVTPEEIQQTLEIYFQGLTVRGLILTGFDADHAHPRGVEWILSEFGPDWVMYPKCYKESDTTSAVFASINKHERSRAKTSRPLIRHSVRLDKLGSRVLNNLGDNFELELFSPHIEDMDSSNNCSIVAKITGTDSTGFQYLITGDTEVDRWESIGRLFGKYLASDIMAASHHGSVTGTHVKTLLDISPNTILISAGVDNQFDHPRSAAVQTYQAVAEHVWATNAGGIARNLFTQRHGSDFKTTSFRHALTAN